MPCCETWFELSKSIGSRTGFALENRTEVTTVAQTPLDSVSGPIWALASVFGKTWRISKAECGMRNAEYGIPTPHSPLVYCFWHEYLLAGFWLLRKQRPAALVSQSRDGTRLSAVLERWGYELIRGSSSKDGSVALQECVAAVRAGKSVVITPDGPTGPRREAKSGVARIAREAGVPVLCLGFQIRPAIRVNSWDRFVVPPPFASVAVRESLLDPGDFGTDRAGQDQMLARIAEAMNA
jgi:lysophospholipid acyltransferase (LPLAT)-like uncharacterized protein